MERIALQGSHSSGKKAARLLNEYLPVDTTFMHVAGCAGQASVGKRRMPVTGLTRLATPVIYSPSLPVAAQGCVFIPTDTGVCLNLVIKEDNCTYRTLIEAHGNTVCISTPVYTNYDELRGNYNPTYDYHVFILPWQ